MGEQGSVPAKTGARQPQRGRWIPSRIVAEVGTGLDRLWAGRWPFGPSPIAVNDATVIVRLPGPLRRVGQAWTSRAPRADVVDRGHGLVVEAELPGVRREDLDIAVEAGALVIRGERRTAATAEDPDAARAGRFAGRYYRRLPLPEGVAVDQITARYADGVLEVTIPKLAAKIPIA